MTSGEIEAKGKVESEPAGANVHTWCARVVTSVTALAEGYDIGSISGIAVLLRKDLGLTSQQVGQVIGVLSFAMIVGAPLGGWLADAAGRKKALGATYLALIAGSLVMALATSFEAVLLGRAVLGIAVGAGFSVVTAYITEVSPKRHRGTFVGLEDLFLVTGISVGYGLNYLLDGVLYDWRWMAAFGALPPALGFALLFLPQVLESPRWLMLRGDRARAEHGLALLVGEEEARNMLDEWGHQAAPCSWGDVIFPVGSSRRNAILAGIGITVLGLLCGIGVFTVYLGTILAGELPDSQVFALSMFIGIGRILILLLAVFVLMDGWGRKPMMLASMAGMSIFMSLTSYFYWAKVPAMPMKFVALLGYALMYSFGLGPVSLLYAAEILPTEMRSKAFSLGTMLARLMAGSMIVAFPHVQEHFGLHCIFAFFAVVNMIGFVMVALYAPETRGTSLEEMHTLFGSPSHKRKRKAENGAPGTGSEYSGGA